MPTTYATPSDVQARMTRTMDADEQAVCQKLLEDAAVIIDASNVNATADAKLVVSCRMVIRALGDGESSGVPMGASQGSMSGLGYSQSWTIGTGGSVGELYLGKLERRLLGAGDRIGSYSPVQELAPEVITT
jgi:hypothetical protein